MLNLNNKNLKAMFVNITLAFLFSFIILFSTYYIFKDNILFYTSLLNKMAIDIKKENNYDKTVIENNKITNYPSYGDVFANLSIPNIGVNEKVYHGDTLDIIKNGIGHYSGSYFPGEGGTVILAAHNSKKHFMYLPKLKIGDIAIIDTTYGTYKYKMISSKIIKDNDYDSLEVSKDKEILIMYTCYPVNTVGHKDKRYVVYLELVGDSND